ncbi:60S ribosomal protein L36 [Staphylotrichum longicolle]|uniref:60S ribosomal protein L36 n=1 Tax=Staphylotrichum longicolle TaxID=669026 RepID=A0AAD4I2D5_9PEZI|nr:60S ribosomal protein L36 [Staphylotrichum longicolle]
MAKDTEKSGLAQGLNKGHKTTARVSKPRPSQRKGKSSKRTQFVRSIVKEVAGLAPYERRVIELIRNGKDKRARKYSKRKLGTFGRAKAKVEEMQRVIAESRRAGH